MIPFVEFLASETEISPSVADQISTWAVRQQKPLGMIAVDHGLIIGPQIDDVLDRQRQTKKMFGEIAIEMGFLTQAKLDELLNIQGFRVHSSIVEALGLAGVVPFSTGVGLLSNYIQREPDAIFAVNATADIS